MKDHFVFISVHGEIARPRLLGKILFKGFRLVKIKLKGFLK